MMLRIDIGCCHSKDLVKRTIEEKFLRNRAYKTTKY